MVSPIDSLEAPGEPPTPKGVPTAQIQGRSPWYLAWLRLRRNKVALVCAVVFVLIVLFCLAAPLRVDHVAHTGPNDNHITDKVMIDGQETDVVAPDGTPISLGLRGCTGATCSAPTRRAATSWCGRCAAGAPRSISAWPPRRSLRYWLREKEFVEAAVAQARGRCES